MSSRPTAPTTVHVAPVTRADPSPVGAAESRDRRILEQRARIRTRHARALTDLMGHRDDLRGVHALADLVDDAVRWSV